MLAELETSAPYTGHNTAWTKVHWQWSQVQGLGPIATAEISFIEPNGQMNTDSRLTTVKSSEFISKADKCSEILHD